MTMALINNWINAQSLSIAAFIIIGTMNFLQQIDNARNLRRSDAIAEKNYTAVIAGVRQLSVAMEGNNNAALAAEIRRSNAFAAGFRQLSVAMEGNNNAALAEIRLLNAFAQTNHAALSILVAAATAAANDAADEAGNPQPAMEQNRVDVDADVPTAAGAGANAVVVPEEEENNENDDVSYCYYYYYYYYYCYSK